MIIYRATCRTTGKSYIGQTVQSLPRRRMEHESAARGSDNKCPHFHCAIRKYGRTNFVWDVLDTAPDMEWLNELEFRYINLCGTFVNGYNASEGGGNARHSAETRAKISVSNRGKKRPPISAETRAKMSAVRLGKKRSAETCAKISAARTGEKNPFYGKKHSVAARAKIAEAQRGEKHWNFGKSHPAETCAKISEANRGKKHSVETRANMSAAKIGNRNCFYGKCHSPASIKKMRAAKIGNKNPNFGRIFSAEVRAKMSAAAREREARKRERNHAEQQTGVLA